MKRYKKVLIMLCVLVVLCGAAGIIKVINSQKEAAQAAETDTVAILTVDGDQVTAIGWDYDDETVTLARADADSEWTVEDKPELPVSQSTAAVILASLLEVDADKTIEESEVESLSDYGLLEPYTTVTITLSSGDEKTLKIGNETSVGGSRYCSTGDGNVYLVDSGITEDFAYSAKDLIQYESLPDMDSITSVTVERPKDTLQLDYIENSGLSFSDSYVWFTEQDGEETALDTDLVTSFTDNITGLTFTDCIAYNADDAALEVYGLKDPAVTVTVEYTESEDSTEDSAVDDPIETTKTLTLTFSDYDGDSCYCRIGDSKMVYAVDATVLDTLEYTTPDDLLPTDILPLDMDTVDSVDITIDGTTTTVYRKTRTVEAEDSTEEDSTEIYYETEDGTEYDLQSAFSYVLALTSDGNAGDAEPGDEQISLTFHRNTDSFDTVTLTICRYKSTDSIVSVGGESRLLVSRSSVDALVERFESGLNPTDSEE